MIDMLEQLFADPQNMIIVKMLFAVFLGAMVGYTRRYKEAGLRTFTLICLGATIFTLVSIDPIIGTNADKGRVISQIVTGIGFLGVGVIWKSKNRLSGLTTAATIWVTASIGILAGLGMWLVAFVGTLLACIILSSKPALIKARIEKQ